MQVLTVVLGVLVTGIFLRLYAQGFVGGGGSLWRGTPTAPPFPLWMRNHGYWLCCMPLIWAGASILSVRSLDALPEVRPGYLAAGYTLWAALLVGFICSAITAYQGTLRIDGDVVGAVLGENPPVSISTRALVIHSIFCVLGVAGGLFFAMASIVSIANMQVPWVGALVVGAFLVPAMFLLSGVGVWIAYAFGWPNILGFLRALPWVYAVVFALGMTWSFKS